MCVVTFSKATEYKSKKKVTDFNGQPKWGYIEITSQCSHKCSWCYGGFNYELSDFMTLENFKKVADKLEDLGIVQISLAGGEPTDHPDFEGILAVCKDRFIINIVSHGDWSKPDLATVLKKYGVNQVQFNYQGKALHDRVHGVKNSYNNLMESIKSTLQSGIEVVCSLTIGAYNIKRVADIFLEIESLGANRIRVWESTGLGNKFRKDLEVKDIFNVAQVEAKKLGFGYIQSYEPLVSGDVSVPCPALSKLILWVNVKGQHIFCGAAPSQLNNPLSDLLTDSVEVVRSNQDQFVKPYLDQPKFCMARRDVTSDLKEKDRIPFIES